MGAHRAETGLAQRLVVAARSLQQQESVEQTFRVVVDTAPELVDAAEHAGVTALRRDRTVQSRAYTGELALLLDEVQREEGEGPCLAAAERNVVVRIDDMTAETRWPKFAARAAELGVRSLISCGLGLVDGWRVALNFQARRPGAFGGVSGQVAALYAEHAALALGKAATVDSLRGAMNRRQAIGEATGILMERHRTGSGEAFGRLVRASQRLNTKLGVVAEYVTLTGKDPDLITADDLPPAP